MKTQQGHAQGLQQRLRSESDSRERLRRAALSVVAAMALLLASCGTSADGSVRTETPQASITADTIPATTETKARGHRRRSNSDDCRRRRARISGK